MGFKKLALYLGLGNHRFDRLLWQSRPQIRKCFLKDIFESQTSIGMTEKQIIFNFGIDRKIYSTGVWSYRIPAYGIIDKKRFLNFYFDTEGKVKKIKLKFKQKLHK